MRDEHGADLSEVLKALRTMRTELQEAWRRKPAYLLKRQTWFLNWIDRLRTRTSGLDFDIVLPAQKRRLYFLRRAEAAKLRKQFEDIRESEERAESENRERQETASDDKDQTQ